MTEVESSILQRIERGNGEILAEMRGFRRELDEEKAIRKEHSIHNREDFTTLRALFVDQTDDRKRHLEEQDVKIDKILADQNFARGIGKAIVAIFGGLFLSIGGAIVAFFAGIIHVKIG